jgi:uncharacterized protein YwgA
MARIQYKKKEEYLEVIINEKVTLKDIQTAWNRVDSKSSNKVNVLIHIKKFKGLEIKALIEDINSFLRHHSKIGKVAIVSDSNVFKFAPTIMKKFFNTNLNHYETKNLIKAKNWITYNVKNENKKQPKKAA